jgi:hypothetical protein
LQSISKRTACVQNNSNNRPKTVRTKRLEMAWGLVKVMPMKGLRILEIKSSMKSRLWATKTRKRMKMTMRKTRKRTTSRWRLTSRARCTRRRRNNREKAANRANKRKQTSRWARLMKNRRKPI